MKKFRTGDFVRVDATNIPVRYQGRIGEVVGRVKVGRGFHYLIDFSPRRLNPLQVSPRFLTFA